ncbi:MAG: 30S ribosomal protein S12 methylthiotransferase RimO [Myxococcota bacterium]
MSKVHFISLGCPKNRVDAEHMLGIAAAAGHQLVQSADDADTIVVNTCSFIGEAKVESVNAILEMAEVKRRGGQKLVVSGCLAQRYVSELENELPEVDHFIGTSDYTAITAVLGAGTSAPEVPAVGASDFVPLSALRRANSPDDRVLVTHDLQFVAGCDIPRINSMPKYTAYLKIAEGCDNTCAFCIIPTLRGKQRSRPIDDLVREAERLAQEGVVELNLIAQDLTGYGHDLPDRPTLAALLGALTAVQGIRWVRCMYAYPRSLSAELKQVLAQGRNTLPYLDIPVQHGSDKMLRRMRRGRDQRRLTELLLGVRDVVPNVVLRSTVIVGFPGEDEDDFQQLVDFVQAVRFERLGVFKYSDEEGTSAYDLDGKLPYKTKRARFDKLMRRQRRIHSDKLAGMVGTVHEAIVEGTSEEHEYLVVGRLWSQAHEIDGITYLSSPRPLRPGEIVHVRITDAHDYDLVAEVLEDDVDGVAQSVPFQARVVVNAGNARPSMTAQPVENA